MAAAAWHSEVASVVSFHAGIEARVVAAARRRKKAQSDRFAIAYAYEFGAFFHDADASGVPARVVKEAWTSYRQAVEAFGASSDLKVRYGGEYGDCRQLELVWQGSAIGTFSILDDEHARSAAEIARDLQCLINSSSQ